MFSQVVPWLWNGHAETIFAALTRRKLGLQYERKIVQLEDGGVVALDHEPAEMDKVCAVSKKSKAAIAHLKDESSVPTHLRSGASSLKEGKKEDLNACQPS